MGDLLTTGQVQDLLHVDRTTIYRMVDDGRLSAIRVGKQWRFPREELERWLHSLHSQANPGPAAPAPRAGAEPRTAPSPTATTGGLAEILPMACTQLIQDAFAEMLGAMVVITDMQGRPVTEISNPCGFFAAAIQNTADGSLACRRTWQALAASVSLEPRFVSSELGLLCARGLIRLRSELKGIVVVGGIAPEAWPPSPEQIEALAGKLGAEPEYLAANANAVYRLDKAQRERALRSVQRIADIFSHIAEDRSLIYNRLQAIAALTTL
jgi:excisionase family DNA binding protein